MQARSFLGVIGTLRAIIRFRRDARRRFGVITSRADNKFRRTARRNFGVIRRFFIDSLRVAQRTLPGS
jgi:hypothetical protein